MTKKKATKKVEEKVELNEVDEEAARVQEVAVRLEQFFKDEEVGIQPFLVSDPVQGIRPSAKLISTKGLTDEQE
jgi:hypothetical protein